MTKPTMILAEIEFAYENFFEMLFNTCFTHDVKHFSDLQDKISCFLQQKLGVSKNTSAFSSEKNSRGRSSLVSSFGILFPTDLIHPVMYKKLALSQVLILKKSLGSDDNIYVSIPEITVSNFPVGTEDVLQNIEQAKEFKIVFDFALSSRFLDIESARIDSLCERSLQIGYFLRCEIKISLCEDQQYKIDWYLDDETFSVLDSKINNTILNALQSHLRAEVDHLETCWRKELKGYKKIATLPLCFDHLYASSNAISNILSDKKRLDVIRSVNVRSTHKTLEDFVKDDHCSYCLYHYDACDCDKCYECDELVEYCECDRCKHCSNLENDCECDRCSNCDFLLSDCDCECCSNCDLVLQECICNRCDKCGDLEDDCDCDRCDKCGDLEDDCDCDRCDKCGDLVLDCVCDHCDLCFQKECECENQDAESSEAKEHDHHDKSSEAKEHDHHDKSSEVEEHDHHACKCTNHNHK